MRPSCAVPVRFWMAVMAAGILSSTTSSTAHAQRGQQGERLVIFPMEDGGLDSTQGSLPGDLTQALARATEARGMKVTVLQASLDDTALMAGCASTEDVSCHELLLGQLDADSGLTSTVEPAGEGRVKVTVRYMDGKSEPVVQTFELSTAEAEKDLEGATPAVFGDPVAPGVGDDVTVSGGGGGMSFDIGQVKRTSWYITGGGAALMGVGTLFWLGASSKQGEIDDAPTDTPDQLDRLADLEGSAQSQATLGNIAFFTGMAVVAVGGYFVVRQGLSGGSNPAPGAPDAEAAPEPGGITWAPVPLPGGVGVTMSMEWP